MSTSSDDVERVREWTEQQRRQSEIAIFEDHALSFGVACSPGTVLRDSGSTLVDLRREETASLRFPGLETIGGLDISFRDSSGDEGVAVLSILSYPDLKLVRAIRRQVSLRETPYVHSYLSFRESDHYVSLLRDLEASGHCLPQVLLVDGNGRWHPRQAGSAVALGVKVGIPTIGVAKDYLPIHATDPYAGYTEEVAPDPYPRDFMMSQKGMRKACQALLGQRGDWISLSGIALAQDCEKSNVEVGSWGAAVLASPARNARNPIFVSPGHRLSLETSVRIALACSINGKVPEPIRQADLLGRAEVKRIWG